MADYSEVLKIDVDTSKAVASIQQYQKQLKEVNTMIEDATLEYGAQSKEVIGLTAKQKLLTDQIRRMNTEVKNEIQQATSQKGSIVQLRAEYNKLKQEYVELGEAGRDSIAGQAMLDKMANLNNQIKELEQSYGQFGRNVGNYKESIISAFDSTEIGKWFNTFKGGIDNLVNSMPAVDRQTMETGSTFKKVGVMGKAAIGGIEKALMSLLANPIVLGIAAIVAVIALVVKAMDNSEERTEKLKVAMAKFQPVIDAVQNALGFLADGLVKIIELYAAFYGGVIDAIGAVTDFIGITDGASETTEKYNKITEEEIALEHERREQKKSSAKQDLEVAQLRDKLAKTDKKDTKEREKLLKQAIDIEQQKADKDLELAKREYENMKAKQALSENDKEANDALAEAEAKMYQAQTQHLQETRKLQQQLTQMREENAKAAEEEAKKQEEANKKAIEARKKQVEEYKKQYDKQISEQRKAQDLMIANINDSNKREELSLKVTYQREIADLKARLKNEKDLTAKARKAIKEQMVEIEKKYQKDLANLQVSQANANMERERTLYENRLAVLENKSEEWLKVKQQELDLERQMELNNADLTNEEKEAIEAKYNQQRLDLDKEFYQRKKDEADKNAQLALQNELAQMKLNGASEVELLEEQLRQSKEKWLNMEQGENESMEAYKNRSLQMQQQIADQEKALADKRVAIEKAKTDAVIGMGEQMVGAAKEVFGENKALMAMEKTLAVAKVALELGKSIAEATANSVNGDPYTMAIRIATNVASVVASMASATKAISSAKFATGGLVGGRYTNDTSDNVSARLSVGESVINSRATAMYAPILSALNQSAGGAPINAINAGASANNNNYLAQQFAIALQAMPNPIVSVAEFTDVSNRVKAIEGNASF